MEDGKPLSGAVQRLLLLLLRPEMLLLGGLQAHSDHLRTSQHLHTRPRSERETVNWFEVK